MNTWDVLVEDFTDERFRDAYREYARDMGVSVKSWDRLFEKMNRDPHGKNYAYLRISETGETVGFLQFTELEVTSWFFKTTVGFIREFWVAQPFRNRGHGSQLLQLTEEHFRQRGLPASILTTDTAADFYRKHGYVRMDGISPDNEETTFLKALLNH